MCTGVFGETPNQKEKMEFPIFEHSHGYLLEYPQVSRMFVKNAGPNFEDDGLLGWIVSENNEEEALNILANTIW
jgi:hypothetical protein